MCLLVIKIGKPEEKREEPGFLHFLVFYVSVGINNGN